MVAGGNSVPLGGQRRRVLLTVLALHAGETVHKDQLIDELWPESMPRRVNNALQALVARLRRQLDAHLGTDYSRQNLVTAPTGYRLSVDPADVDAKVFMDRVAHAKKVLNSDPGKAQALLESALSLWRGPALHGVLGGPLCRSALLELDERRLAAIEASVQVGVALGDSRVISELKKLVLLYPWQERFTELLMVSLYRAGRQVEAMDAYQQARTRLVEDLGLEPSPHLRDHARAILNHDPALLAVGGA